MIDFYLFPTLELSILFSDFPFQRFKSLDPVSFLSIVIFIIIVLNVVDIIIITFIIFIIIIPIILLLLNYHSVSFTSD